MGGDPGGDCRDSRGRRALELLQAARTAIERGRPQAALPLLEEAGRLKPGEGEIHLELGRALNNLSRLPQSRVAFGEAVRLLPKSAIAWNNLGHVCRAMGDIEAASEAFGKALALDPGSSRALVNVASVCLARGEVERGLRLLRRAEAADPSDPMPRSQIGDVLQNLGRYEEAERSYAAALGLDSDYADALTGMGAVMLALGKHDAAEDRLRRALELRPHDQVALASLVHVLELRGQPEEILSLIDSRNWPSTPAWAAIAAARQLLRLGQTQEAAARLGKTDWQNKSPRDRAAALNVRARILESQGDYEGAFQCFHASNTACPSSFDPDGFRNTIDRLIGFFTRERLSRLPASGCQSERPVFIVGMPRSGTSLVEQILGCHTRVHACGERTDLYRLPRQLSGGSPAAKWPECLAELEPKVLERSARDYLEREIDIPAGTLRATDKLPANLLNLGFLQLLFPKARVIYCRRDPMDVGLSCFQQDFESRGMDFARDLSHIGLYQQGCQRLMEHWGQVLDLGMQIVDYETLVADPERHIRALVSFLDLDWEDDCLRFHQSDRVVRTASHAQVRRPVYDFSIGRWRRYQEWLGPLRESLETAWPAQREPSNR